MIKEKALDFAKYAFCQLFRTDLQGHRAIWERRREEHAALVRKRVDDRLLRITGLGRPRTVRGGGCSARVLM
jgi:hypothetical protein